MSLEGHDQALQGMWRQDIGWPAIKLTVLGGYAVALVAYEALVEGEIVRISTASDMVRKSSVSDDMPVGAVYQDASSGATAWVVVAGVAYVLPDATVTAEAGYVCYVSALTAGRVQQSATMPGGVTNFAETGHWLSSGTGAGVKTKALMHFN
jgi:hypothetical protein